MKKKIYQSPHMNVVKVTAQHMLCDSVLDEIQNESYEEVSVQTTNDWFN